MDFTDYMIAKFIVLALLAFFGNFVCAFFTGRSLEQVRNGIEVAERQD